MTTTAETYQPLDGWENYTKDSHYNVFNTPTPYAEFHIGLGILWYDMPMYSLNTYSHGKFSILVHELSHIFLDARDHMYQYKCQELAVSNSIKAKKNADNWAFFVESFRLP